MDMYAEFLECISVSTSPEAGVRTTLDLDRGLLEKAKAALGAPTFTAAIETALRDAVERAETREAWGALIGSELSWEGVADLLEFRRAHGGRAL